MMDRLMAKKQRRIPPVLKRELVDEAGGKCANPGCVSWRTHIHHIKHWAVYKTHDGKHMIAICPSCHDAVHHNNGITDDTLYAWKKICRSPSDIREHLYVEPSKENLVLIGSTCFATTNTEAIVFRLSNLNNFSFKILEEDIFLASCSIKDLSGQYLIRIFDNHIKIKNYSSMKVERRPGRICVTVLDVRKYLPSWAFQIMWRSIPEFIRKNESTLLELEVIRPGVVRLQGTFVANNAVFAITESKIYILRPEMAGPIAIVGEGEGTKFVYSGPITEAFFQL